MKNKSKYYKSKYFFGSIIIVSLIFLFVNFLLTKNFGYFDNQINYQVHQDGIVKGAENNNEIQSDFELVIDQIQVKTPVTMDVDGTNENIYFSTLKKGVAHLLNSSKPGEKGNSVIFGHSSQATGEAGNYGEVFAKLHDLKENDEIKFINHKNNKEFTYKVYDKQVVMPESVEVTYQTNDDRLTLITCWPIGSDKERLVVIAKKVE